MRSLLASLLTLSMTVIGARGQSCKTTTLATTVPLQITTGVGLQSYSYCGGKLIAVAFVANLNYDKIINIWYTNARNESNALSVVPLTYWAPVGVGSIWEFWGTLSPVYADGITSLLNITYTAVSLNKTYSQVLNIPVVSSGPPVPSLSQPPLPSVTPQGLSGDITNALSTVQGSIVGDAVKNLFKNINPNINGSSPGSVIAAQSGPDFTQKSPNYEVNRVRDAALAMYVVQTLYSAATEDDIKSLYENLMFEYATDRATEQTYPGLVAGLGEPLFYLNQTLFTGSTSKPTNDGAALSAITLMQFATEFLASGGNTSAVRQYVYDSTTFPSTAPVQKDLLYVAASWANPSYDLWQEVSGTNFFTRLVQRRALVMGVAFANRMGDSATALTLTSALNGINPSLVQFWDAGRSTLVYEYGPVLNAKTSYLDMSVILGVLHGYADDDIYSFSNDQVLSSAAKIATSFINIYPINNVTRDSVGRVLGNAIGRYPEDTFNGNGTGAGNPWFLTTAAMAQFLYSVSKELSAGDQIVVTNTSKPFFDFFAPAAKLSDGQTYVSTSSQFRQAINGINGWGDAYLRRVVNSIPSSGIMSEQFDRSTAAPAGASSLTWSHVALLTAAFARADLVGNALYVTNLANEGFLSNSSD